MRDLLQALASRELIIVLAVAGALLATYGSHAKAGKSPSAYRRGRLCEKSGYAVTGLSVLAFIVAGFVAQS